MKNGRLSESTLNHLLEGFQLISFQWQYLYVNDAAVKQSKVSREQLVGRTMMEVYPGIENSDMFQSVKRCMEQRTNTQIESVFNYPDKTQGWFDLHIQSVPEGVFILSIDITQRKRAEKDLEQMNEKLEMLVKARTTELQAKTNELMDSLSYARHIQGAFLNTRSQIEQSFTESFILYKPKSVVSGDFYWCRKKENAVLVAAADCTGHGVPGALMSMIGIEKLNRACDKSDDPAVILRKLNKEIKGALQSAAHDLRSYDGMDIALCSISTDRKKLVFSGASRPLWIMRKDGEVMEQYKTCIRSIGGYTEVSQAFGSIEIDVEKGDTLYMFSDGYADSFGGPSAKKLTSKRFRELLTSIKHLPMARQHHYLDVFLEQWKAGNEQTDDVLVIGIRI
jgi:PAS domain S-box-containing protein